MPHASVAKPSWKPQEYGRPESFPAGRHGRAGAGKKAHRVFARAARPRPVFPAHAPLHRRTYPA